MTIELSDKQTKELRRLLIALDNQNINIKDVKTFLGGLEQKISAPPSRMKERRKNFYIDRFKNSIHGNVKKII